MMKIKVIEKNGIATIDGMECTFQTKEIRDEIEDLLEVNEVFNLPKKYTYQVTKSNLLGKVAKIIKKSDLENQFYIVYLYYFSPDDLPYIREQGGRQRVYAIMSSRKDAEFVTNRINLTPDENLITNELIPEGSTLNKAEVSNPRTIEEITKLINKKI